MRARYERGKPARAWKRMSGLVTAQVAMMGISACSGGGVTEDGAGAGGVGGSGGADIIEFCDVDPILEAKCRRCHGDPPSHGAPFSLVGFASVEAEYPAGSGGVLPEIMIRAIETDFMPYRGVNLDPPVEDLTGDEETLLLSWLRAGAPRGQEECD